jgi:hypothetical protein
MIYHLNEIDDETGEYLDMYTRRLDNPAKDNPATAPWLSPRFIPPGS